MWVGVGSSRRRHTRYWRDWSSDVCSSDLVSNELRKGFILLLLAPNVAQSLLELIKSDSFLSRGLLSHFVQLILDVLGILRCRLELLLEAIDRKSVVSGKSVDVGGRRIKQKTAYEILA